MSHIWRVHNTNARARIALVTYAGAPALTADDALLGAALEARDAIVEARPWDMSADWASYDRIVLRSPWNFHHVPGEFLEWIEHVGAIAPGALRNNARVVRWNVSKRYLAELEARGIAIVPTVWIDGSARDAPPSLEEIMRGDSWAFGAVVKPVISATAHHTWRIDAGDGRAHQTRFEGLVRTATDGVMVQPFVPEIVDGEWSLIFFGDTFSHAVVKRPASGDFRVQHDFGGTAEHRVPPTRLIDDAAGVMRAVAAIIRVDVRDLLYARIDGIVRSERLVLMEAELIEPALFLARAPGAADRMAELILRND